MSSPRIEPTRILKDCCGPLRFVKSLGEEATSIEFSSSDVSINKAASMLLLFSSHRQQVLSCVNADKNGYSQQMNK